MKRRDPFNYPKKAKHPKPKITGGMITIHQNMTVEHLADAMGKSVGRCKGVNSIDRSKLLTMLINFMFF